MTKQAMENKVDQLEFWLKGNPNHANYQVVLNDKKELERKIIAKDYDKK